MATKTPEAETTLTNTAVPSALRQALAALQSRSPEETRTLHESAQAAILPPRVLPPGQSLFDAIAGLWPGDETDEQVADALRKLS